MLSLLRTLKEDWSLSASVAGFLAVLIAYAGPLVIFFQAAQAAQVSDAMMASWIWGISIGTVIPGIYLSIKYKTPIVAGWSAPGTALLVTLFPQMSINEAVAAYIISAIAVFLVGITGSFDKLLQWIPNGIAAGMMAGILFQFGLELFIATDTMPIIVFSMLACYLLAKRFSPRYTMIWVLSCGVILSTVFGKMNPVEINLAITIPQFISPEWTWRSVFNLAIPLTLVSLSGQFLPGMAILKLSGYEVSAKPIVSAFGIASLAVAFVGGITVTLGAITAALCTGKDSHEDKDKRYIAGIANSLFYLLGGLFAGSIVAVFSLLPKELIAALAGLALIGAISANVHIAMREDSQRDSALITFMATASGMQFLGLSSVFWGVVIGMIAHYVLTKKRLLPTFLLSLNSKDDK